MNFMAQPFFYYTTLKEPQCLRYGVEILQEDLLNALLWFASPFAKETIVLLGGLLTLLVAICTMLTV